MIWWSQKFSVFIYSVTVSVDFTCSFQMVSIYASIVEQKLNLIIGSLLISLRRQVTFGNAATGFPAKWCLRKECRNSILMTCHYPDLGSASDWLNQISHVARTIRSTTQTWVVKRYQYGISTLVSQTSFGRETIGSIATCRPFFQANYWFKIFPQLIFAVTKKMRKNRLKNKSNHFMKWLHSLWIYERQHFFNRFISVCSDCLFYEHFFILAQLKNLDNIQP